MSIYDFRVKAQNGEDVPLSDYKGKLLLIVNTATGCGFTPQYEELQQIYDAYHDEGFEILDFPCNQFGEQAPGSDEQIQSFCTMRFGTTFPRFSKVEVTGDGAIPLYKWLAANSSFEGFGNGPMGLVMRGVAKKRDKNYKSNGNVKWNFTKFLISRDGRILARMEPTLPMKRVEQLVREALRA